MSYTLAETIGVLLKTDVCIQWVRVFVDRKLVKAPPSPAPSNFIAGRPKATLLFWFCGDFRCGMSLFIVIRLYIDI